MSVHQRQREIRAARLPGWSLRGRLLILWAISLVSAVAAGTMLVQLYRQSSIDQVARAEAVIGRACDEIASRYRFYTTGWTQPPADLHDEALRNGLLAVLAIALAHDPGVEGGIWHRTDGSLAYAYPTYEGAGPKTDLPLAEAERIRTANAGALAEERAVDARQVGRLQTLLLHACPLPGPIDGVTAWTMTRVFTGQGAGYARLIGGLGVLLASVLASAGWTTHLLLTWSRKLGRVEATVERHEGLDPPLLEPTGERELDRIIASLNAAALKVRAMRREAETLSAQVAASERLAGLGRVAAGIAHEIRNPIAAMRLKAENALLSDDARRRAALEMMLGQIGRLDALLRDLLTLTHRSEPRWQRAPVSALLAATAELHRDTADSHGVKLRVQAPAMAWPLDPDRMQRALDNLVLNAIQSMPTGGAVTIAAEEASGALRLRVTDDGPGLPVEVRQHLFEPFVSARADGTGLGLSIVREIALAHGGTVSYRPENPGSTFELIVPHREGSCPGSSS
jgi:signal transduction histidine kinase